MCHRARSPTCWKPGAKFVGDKSPRFFCLASERLKKLFPKAKFINVLRDERNAIISRRFYEHQRKRFEPFASAKIVKKVRHYHL